MIDGDRDRRSGADGRANGGRTPAGADRQEGERRLVSRMRRAQSTNPERLATLARDWMSRLSS
jgi:hypothetical protein